ncbi:MAG TPA: DNA-3-methyladenine glycosylase [Nitrososphaeria archaeon]|nr:MAG: DNA-3-methyladenine glycosylase [Nitrososphaerota archaeon]HDJ66590.1 DNA-3-methyladenine glycosylase [Nitrososphaeria archaeon]
MFKRLGRDFYERCVVDVAKDLLGKLLIRRIDGQVLIGRIVEAEAYRGPDDPASHAYRGKTERNKVMFDRGGLAYIYLAYGIHRLLNVTAEPPGKPAAVLIRALEPIKGVEVMRRFRGTSDLRALTSGPGRLTEALSIDLKLNGLDLTSSDELFIADDEFRAFKIASSPRIGVRDKRRWRFYVEGNKFVSRP